VRGFRGRTLVIVGAVLVLAACSSSSKSSTTTTTLAKSSTTTTTLAKASANGGSVLASTTTTTSGAAGTAALKVVTNAMLGKQIMVAASGKTLYLYMPDGTSTTSKVPAGLKAAWPAVTISGAPAIGAGLDKTKLAVETQPDGTKQVSYNGHLLYTFSGDAGPGTASGEGLGDIWFVLSPAGAKA